MLWAYGRKLQLLSELEQSSKRARFSIPYELFDLKSFIDVTIAAEGGFVKAHRLILSASSEYFQVKTNYICSRLLFLTKDFPLFHLAGYSEPTSCGLKCYHHSPLCSIK